MSYKDPVQQREFQRQWMLKRRSEWIQANGPCQHCGSWVRLEVDHVDPSTKSMNPAAIWSRSEKVRQRELDKCQVLCFDCHKEKTIVDSNFARGEANGSSKLNPEAVRDIRSSALTYNELAEKYGVTRSCIAKVKSKKNWSHID